MIADDVPDIVDGGIIDWSELESVYRGTVLVGFVGEVNVLNRESRLGVLASGWNIDALLIHQKAIHIADFCHFANCNLPRGQFLSVPYTSVGPGTPGLECPILKYEENRCKCPER